MSRLFSGTPLERPISCELCGKAAADCRCIKLPPKNKMRDRQSGKQHQRPVFVHTPQNSDPPKDQIARVRVEKRKGNRTATIIAGLDHPANDLPKLLNELKAHLGSGGSIQERTLELQGDHVEGVCTYLQAQGIKARKC